MSEIVKIEIEKTAHAVGNRWSWEATDAKGTTYWGFECDLDNAIDAARNAADGGENGA